MSQRRLLFVASVVLTTFASISAGDTVTGTITGTCGFYQGTRSNVVFSQPFNGGGCGAYFKFFTFAASWYSEYGGHNPEQSYIDAYGYHDLRATAPDGEGVFVSFDDTLQVAKEFVVNSLFPSTAPTELLFMSFAFPINPFCCGIESQGAGAGGEADSGGTNSCETTASVDSPGMHRLAPPNDGFFTIPVSIGQPFTFVTTVHMKCDKYGTLSWGDQGGFQATAGPFLVADLNGNLQAGPYIFSEVPETGSVLLIALLGLPLLAISRLAFSRAR